MCLLLKGAITLGTDSERASAFRNIIFVGALRRPDKNYIPNADALSESVTTVSGILYKQIVACSLHDILCFFQIYSEVARFQFALVGATCLSGSGKREIGSRLIPSYFTC